MIFARLKYGLILFSCIACLSNVFSQTKPSVWIADNLDGTYKNPVIHADYSDPDAIRVGDDYYMVSSSFNHIPGLPILHSIDLVNWKLIGHALQQLPPKEHFSTVRHGGGVWAPSIRFYNSEFYIYFPDPDFGIYVTKAKAITGPWSEPVLVERGKGLIDPCPLWDDDGKAYLTHAYAGSRAGFKSIIVVKEMDVKGEKMIGNAVMVFDGQKEDPTVEGPKFYKRNGYYYIFAPAGGVSTGWQLVLRSKNVYGPYERKVVMDQGATTVNGPHQGAWVDTKNGQDWFLHFQDIDAYGRVVHLQPMQWINDWPVIGMDTDKDGKGEPALRFKKPDVGKAFPVSAPPESDEFDKPKLGLQWQWQANPEEGWAFPTASGYLRIFSVYKKDSLQSAWDYPNILGQKFPAEKFTSTVKLTYKFKHPNERFGFIVHGADYAFMSLINKPDGIYITYNECKAADKSKPETEMIIGKLSTGSVFLRVSVSAGAMCTFSYSEDGVNFKAVNTTFKAKPGRWVGARVGMFFNRNNQTNDAGFADIDWFRVE
jgi:beta-xylosidase